MRAESVMAAGLVLLVALGAGCVERKVLIRSEPSGAPVWVDEQAVGNTPVDLRFEHYGRRRILVGPVRDEKDKVRWAATERVVEIEAPWYETFPIDFLFEVLWPGTLVDRHWVEIQLQPASEQEDLYGEARAEEVRRRAEEFRKQALTPVPELREE